MEEITRGGSKNGPVYQGNQTEINEMNNRLMKTKVQQVPKSIRTRPASNDEQRQIDGFLLRICNPIERKGKYISITKREIETIQERIDNKRGK